MLNKELVHIFSKEHVLVQVNQELLRLLTGHVLYLVSKASKAEFLL